MSAEAPGPRQCGCGEGGEHGEARGERRQRCLPAAARAEPPPLAGLIVLGARRVQARVLAASLTL